MSSKYTLQLQSAFLQDMITDWMICRRNVFFLMNKDARMWLRYAKVYKMQATDWVQSPVCGWVKATKTLW